MDAPRFVTLTIRNKDRSLKECTDHLVESFRRLRRHEDWKDRVAGGIWTIEIKQGKKEGTWHVHLHMLVDGKYYEQSALSLAWLQATGDSSICHITKVNSAKSAANYIAKYVAKPGDFSMFTQSEILDFARAMKGRRLLGTFGTSHSLKLEEAEPTVEAPTETARISANKLRNLETTGFVPAMRACDILERCGGYWAASVGRTKSETTPRVTESELVELGELITAAAIHVECLLSEQESVSVKESGPEVEEPQYCQLKLKEDWLMSPYR
jgi:hypothetical protein